MHLLSGRAGDFVTMEDRYGAQNYAPLDLVVERAEGVWLWDVDGKRYLDCVSAYSAVNQGHCHPHIHAALIEQAARVTLTSRAMRNDRLPGFLQRLTQLCGYDKALPMNTGVEAVETAIKLARRWGYDVKSVAPDRAEIIVFDNNFHGRTIAAISASTTPQYRRSFGPLVPGFVSAPFGDSAAVAAAITPNTCAILVEPIQGEAGVNVPPEGFLQRLAALCRENGLLLLADEIQTGLGRTGTLFACDREGVKPDILLVGKALGGGYYPVSAALANEPVMRLFGPGDHGSTFGGNPLACAVAQAALEVIVDEDLPARAQRSGAAIVQGLQALSSPLVREIRGRGLLIGLDLTVSARAVSDALLDLGVAAKDTHDSVLRIAPPLVIDEPAIEFLLAQLDRALSIVAAA
jgi:ornithine--oxo-acid transaminase